MSRPKKCRRICCLPEHTDFGPLCMRSASDPIDMALDEFESIRLIDLESMTQEQCAVRMNVARTTAQAVYNSARKKLAACLVLEKNLLIEGGEYVLCDGDAEK
ncbi:MAG: DUF134 domain-containing protein, partial [Clostridia bacterium]